MTNSSQVIIVKRKEILKMELNKIHNINFLENTLPDKCAKLIIVDPAYFEEKEDIKVYSKNVKKWAVECKRLLDDNGTLFWYGEANKIAYTQIVLDKHFDLLNNLVWENTGLKNEEWIYFSRHFPQTTKSILMYTSEYDSFNYNSAIYFEERQFENSTRLTDVLRFNKKLFSENCKFPIKLTSKLILTCSRPNDLVLLPFIGEGIECAMAVKQGRKTVGFEIEEKKCQMSNRKVQRILGTHPFLADA